MRAVRKLASGGGNVALCEVPSPSPKPGEVKIRVEAAGICGTDIHMFHGRGFSFRPPVTLGHEGTGRVVEVGEGVDDISVGDRVVPETAVQVCGKCIYCEVGSVSLCPERRSIGSALDGLFAEYCVLPASKVYKLPDNVSSESAALCEPLACAVHAVLETAAVAAGDLCLVTGPGPIGLLVSAVLLSQGARVVLLGTPADEGRLAVAQDLGVQLTVDDGEKAVQRVLALSDGWGADFVFECSGNPKAVAYGVEAIRKRGRFIQIGLTASETIDFNLSAVVSKELQLLGSFGQRSSAWRKALVLLKDGLVDVTPIITHRLPLEEWERGFQLVEKQAGLKVLLQP